jgi:hypothetical protein
LHNSLRFDNMREREREREREKDNIRSIYSKVKIVILVHGHQVLNCGRESLVC